jgi:hypothetical protein
MMRRYNAMLTCVYEYKDLVLYAPVAIRLSCKTSTRCSSLATLVSSPALPFQSWMKDDVPLCAGDEKINERKGEKVFVICQNSSLEIPN